MSRIGFAFFALTLAGCNGTTGNALVSFSGSAGGPADAAPGLTYTTGSGYALTLDRARLHLGAVYLNQNNPLSGAGETGCVLPGIYVGEVFGPLDLDLLSPTLVPFPGSGEGTQTTARTGEVWLLQGDIDQVDSQTVVFDVAGTATKDGTSWPFSAQVTIGQNRALAPPNLALPGANPICKQRIVTPIAIDLTPTENGALVLRIDPRPMFDGVDFTLAMPDASTPPHYVIPDEKGGISDQLFHGLRASAGVYDLRFEGAH